MNARKITYSLLVILLISLVGCAPQPTPTAEQPKPTEIVVEPTKAEAAPVVATEEPTKPAEVPEIKIGVIYPLSGPQALTGFEYHAGAELVQDLINNAHPEWAPLLFADTEGIPNLGGAKIKIIYGDSQAVPERGQNEAERLITQEGVVALVGAFNSSVTATASQVAERYGIPFVCDSASSPTLTSRGFEYFFRVFGHDGLYVKNLMTFLKETAEKNPDKPLKTMVLLHENSLWGSDVAKIVQELAPQYGFELLDVITYPSSTTQVNSEVQRVIAKNPDVLVQAAYLSDSILYMKTFKEQNYAPPMYMYVDGKPLNQSYRQTLASDGWYTVFRTAYTTKEAPFIKPVLKYFGEKYPSLRFNENQAGVITAVQTIADAINRAGSAEPEAIRNALKETNIKGDQILFPFEGVAFDETGQNFHARAVVVQAQEDFNFVNLWPAEFKNGELKDFPKWNER